MSRWLPAAALLLVASSPGPSPSTAHKTVGGLTILAEPAQPPQAGLVVVRLRERRPLGATFVVFDGRRAPVYSTPHGLRALVPVPVGATPGAEPLGVEVFTRRGRQRVPLDVSISEVTYPARTLTIPEAKRALLKDAKASKDSRRVLGLLRTETTAALWSGPFQPP